MDKQFLQYRNENWDNGRIKYFCNIGLVEKDKVYKKGNGENSMTKLN